MSSNLLNLFFIHDLTATIQHYLQPIILLRNTEMGFRVSWNYYGQGKHPKLVVTTLRYRSPYSDLLRPDNRIQACWVPVDDDSVGHVHYAHEAFFTSICFSSSGQIFACHDSRIFQSSSEETSSQYWKLIFRWHRPILKFLLFRQGFILQDQYGLTYIDHIYRENRSRWQYPSKIMEHPDFSLLGEKVYIIGDSSHPKITILSSEGIVEDVLHIVFIDLFPAKIGLLPILRLLVDTEKIYIFGFPDSRSVRITVLQNISSRIQRITFSDIYFDRDSKFDVSLLSSES